MRKATLTQFWINAYSSVALAMGFLGHKQGQGLPVSATSVSLCCLTLGTHPETGCKGRRAFDRPGSREETSPAGR